MHKLLSLLLALCLLCGLLPVACAETAEEAFREPTRTYDAKFATYELPRNYWTLDILSEDAFYDAYLKANYSYDYYSQEYYLDRIELQMTLTPHATPEEAQAQLDADMAQVLLEEVEGAEFVPMELTDGTILYVLCRPGDGFDKPYDCRGVKGNLTFAIRLYLSDPHGDPEDRELLIQDMVVPIVLFLAETPTEAEAEPVE